jgi:hypothetical protein
MKRRWIIGTGLVASVVLVSVQGLLHAQQQPATRSERADLNGVWRFATLTPLERPKDMADKKVLSDEDVKRISERAAQNRAVESQPRPGDPGTYNRFWVESGTSVVATRHTSLVVDPPDGKVPPLTAQGQKREDARVEAQRRAESPESLLISDRCIVGFNAGPPIIPFAYNQNLQIFQTSDYIVLLTEMVHDARIIPLNGRPRLPQHVRQWRGDSRGRWEGKTLVIETTNFMDKGTGTLALSPGFGRRGLGDSGDENLQLSERLTRMNDETLLYEFTMNDPTVWTTPWTASLTMSRSQEPLYEYACHEGNYGMAGILSGARALEAPPASLNPPGR